MNIALKSIGVAAIMTVALGANASFAGLLDNCNTYAQASAKQEQENKLRSCNLTGDFWTTDLKKHIAYCKSVPPQQWKAALKERKNKLAACK